MLINLPKDRKLSSRFGGLKNNKSKMFYWWNWGYISFWILYIAIIINESDSNAHFIKCLTFCGVSSPPDWEITTSEESYYFPNVFLVLRAWERKMFHMFPKSGINILISGMTWKYRAEYGIFIFMHLGLDLQDLSPRSWGSSAIFHPWWWLFCIVLVVTKCMLYLCRYRMS